MQESQKAKKTAIYLRTSTDRQAKGLQAQSRALKEHLKLKGINAHIAFEDEGVSGAKNSRPGLNDLMKACRNGEISAIYVYSFSRFARSTRHLLEAMEEFSFLGVQFVSLTEQLDTSSAIGKALFTIISAIAELEREIISERVCNGLKNAKAKGRKLGRPRQRNSDLIRELASQGLTYQRIAELAGCSTATVCRELKKVS